MPATPDQQRCIDMLDRPVAVSAGAGSGKTFTLTQRIVHALTSGFANGIDEILAITFTKKAAAEIKARVKGALAAAGMPDQALRVDGAWISTIHGMCSRILREHAVELGLDPAFTVLDDRAAGQLRSEAIDEALRVENDMVSPGGLDALFSEFPARSNNFGEPSVERMLDAIVVAAAANPRGMDAISTGPAPASPAQELARVAEVLDAVTDLAEGLKQSAKRDGFIERAREFAEEAHAALDGELDAEGAMRLIAAAPLPPRNIGKVGCPYRIAADDAHEEIASCLFEVRLEMVAPVRDELLALAGEVLRAYERKKGEAGALDNDDLLVLTARALDDPRIARSYVGRFSVVMVDEFQDTDALQIEMIRRLAGDGWERLCTVGDAQQSIYRFRGADVSVFRRHLADVRERNPEGVIELSANFRSHRDVLSFVDRVFERPEAFGGSFMSLSPQRDESRVRAPFLGAGPRIEVVAVSYPHRGVGAAAACEREAEEIAARLAKLREEGHRAGDMAVLLGTMSNAGVFANALRDHGLSSVVQKGSVFNKAPEVQTMVRLAEAIANPRHTAALFEVLSGGMFELSADDFIALSTYYDETRKMDRRQSLAEGVRALVSELAERDAAKGDRRDGGGKGGASPRLEAAVRLLARLQREVGRRPMAKIMADAVRDSGWLSRLEKGGAEGEAVAGNIFKALRVVEDVERTDGTGPVGTARRFAEAVDIAREAPGALATSDGDFVRIMTVHASKGLEFPIVAVAEMEPRSSFSKLECHAVGGDILVSLDAGYSLDGLFSSATKSALGALDPFAGRSEDEIVAALGTADGAGEFRFALRAYERQGDIEERKRLMYVALTRAKEALVVAMRGKETKSGGLLGATTAEGSACRDVVAALFSDGEFPEGETMVDFGGTSPARATLVRLAPAVDEAASAEEGCADAAEAPAPVAQRAIDSVYGPAEVAVCEDIPYAAARESVFSYSSIADAAHRAACGEEPPLDGGRAAAGATFGFDDESAWDALCDSLGDDDRATDLGTAFHRLAQHAVMARRFGAALRRPSADRIEALCRSCHVSGEQRARLDAALRRWFGSDLARAVAMWPRIEAEVPFFVGIPLAEGERFLEGEIDLLATDGACGTRQDPAGAALVVDYKTGGWPGEAACDVREKHRLQATCYAYAVLLQGFASVEAVFVRVEREGAPDRDGAIDALDEGLLPANARGAGAFAADGLPLAARGAGSTFDEKGPDDASEPQYVRYSFSAADLDAVRASIAAAYAARSSM